MAKRSGTPVRVLVHLNQLELGGTQINAVDLSAAVREFDVEPMLVGDRKTLPSTGPTLLDAARARGIDIDLYDAASSQIPRGRQLTVLAGRFRAQLVHVYGSWDGGAGATFWGPARFGRLPWLQTVYEMSVAPTVKRHMPLIVGVRQLLGELTGRPGLTVLISPPVDTHMDRPDRDESQRFRRRWQIGDGMVIALVSRLDPSTKLASISQAIDAMRILGRSHDATLVVVGDGAAFESVAAHAAIVNDAVGRRAVVLTGAVSNPRPAYAAADIMLGMGGSAARSLSFEKPLVVQGDAGWSSLFEPASADPIASRSFWSTEVIREPVERLARVIEPVLTDPLRRAELGSWGRKYAESHFGLGAMSERLADVYGETLQRHRRTDWWKDLPSEWRPAAGRVARRGRSMLRARRSEAEGADD